MLRNKTLAIVALTLIVSVFAFAQTPAPSHEVKAEVPELSAFHEIIYPLWHNAWPNKDMKLMAELLPQIKEHVAALQKAQLPGILREKKAKWDEGVAGIAAAAKAYEQGLAANQQQAVLDAAEKLHSGFEGLVRTIRPPMKELDAYHQVLYQVYHHDWPGKNLDAVKTNAAELAKRCEALSGAALPKRVATKEAEVKAAFTTLCTATGALFESSKSGDWKTIDQAVEKVHTAYQAAEKLFE